MISKLRQVFVVVTIATLFFSSEACKKKDTLTMDVDDTEQVDPLQNKGIGPVKSVTLDGINAGLVSRGQKVFETKCQACHQFEAKVVGPALKGVTQRRSPEWIMNMILNTNEMVEKDPIVKSLIAEYMTKMTYQNVSEEEARALLEFFREKDK